MIETYRWPGGEEALLRHGPASSVTLVILPALFEEANRMRRLTVSVMRHLASGGIGTILPDLPGTGESLLDLDQVTLDDWIDAVSVLATEAGGSIAFRGGALLDERFERRWRFAPDSGERLLRDMVRATAWSQAQTVTDIDERARMQPIRLAGNVLHPAMYNALRTRVSVDNARIAPFEGARLWRAAEPGDDPALAQLLANDIASWVTACDG